MANVPPLDIRRLSRELGMQKRMPAISRWGSILFIPVESGKFCCNSRTPSRWIIRECCSHCNSNHREVHTPDLTRLETVQQSAWRAQLRHCTWWEPLSLIQSARCEVIAVAEPHQPFLTQDRPIMQSNMDTTVHHRGIQGGYFQSACDAGHHRHDVCRLCLLCSYSAGSPAVCDDVGVRPEI